MKINAGWGCSPQNIRVEIGGYFNHAKTPRISLNKSYFRKSEGKTQSLNSQKYVCEICYRQLAVTSESSFLSAII